MSWVFIKGSELKKDKELLEAVKQLPVLWSLTSGAFIRSAPERVGAPGPGVYAVWIGNPEDVVYGVVQGHSAFEYKHLWDN